MDSNVSSLVSGLWSIIRVSDIWVKSKLSYIHVLIFLLATVKKKLHVSNLKICNLLMTVISRILKISAVPTAKLIRDHIGVNFVLNVKLKRVSKE